MIFHRIIREIRKGIRGKNSGKPNDLVLVKESEVYATIDKLAVTSKTIFGSAQS